MQLLTYHNLAGESVLFGAAPPFVLAHIDGTGNTSIERKTFRGANQDGQLTESVLRADRKVDITINIMTFGRSDMYRTRSDELCGALGAGKAFDRITGARARLEYQNDHGKWWTWAIPQGAPKFSKRAQNVHPDIKISFECDTPYWFSMDEKAAGFETSTITFRLPFRFPLRFGSRATEAVVMNSGHAPAPVRIEMHGEGEHPSIVNKTTGHRIALTSPLPAGAILRINTDPADLYVRMEADGAVTNAYGLLDVTTPVSEFLLVPGSNMIGYEPGGASSRTGIALHWHDRFEGV
jgi:hypothetical protein